MSCSSDSLSVRRGIMRRGLLCLLSRISLVAKPIASPQQPPRTHRGLYGQHSLPDLAFAYERGARLTEHASQYERLDWGHVCAAKKQESHVVKVAVEVFWRPNPEHHITRITVHRGKRVERSRYRSRGVGTADEHTRTARCGKRPQRSR